jgi:hypothetical protein
LIVFAVAVCAGAARGEMASRPDERRAVNIAVLGDSLGEGLWASLYRQYWRNRSVKVFNLAKASTGFNAHAYEQDLLTLVERHKIDLLIVQTGANDRQRALALDGKETAYFGTERWYQFYGQRLAHFLGIAQQRKIPVLWVGMPIMRDGRFDDGMRVISRMHQGYAERHGALFLDIADFTADEEGAYAEYLVQPSGRKRRLRHEDGVHSWEFGYDRLAAHVADTIRARFPGLLPDP